MNNQNVHVCQYLNQVLGGKIGFFILYMVFRYLAVALGDRG